MRSGFLALGICVAQVLAAGSAAAHTDDFRIAFDAVTRTVTAPGTRTYAGGAVRIAVTTRDWRYRLSLTTKETALAPLPTLDSLLAPTTAVNDQRAFKMTSSLANEEASAIRTIDAILASLSGEVPLAEPPDDKKLRAARDTLTRLGTIALDADLEFGDALDQRWISAANAALTHLAAASSTELVVYPSADTKVELTVVGTKFVYATSGEGTTLAPVVGVGKEEGLAQTSFEVRSLSYVRVTPGLVFTEVRDRQYRLAPNDIGAPAITGTRDGNLVPMLFFGHYWCGADVREVQPYDTNRWCWQANMLPTFTIGIPLDRSPIKNWFLGALWQPFPGIALVYGAHLGEVTRLRSGFVEGAAGPPAATDFRIGDAVEKRWLHGHFVGFALSDALFVTIIQKLVK